MTNSEQLRRYHEEISLHGPADSPFSSVRELLPTEIHEGHQYRTVSLTASGIDSYSKRINAIAEHQFDQTNTFTGPSYRFSDVTFFISPWENEAEMSIEELDAFYNHLRTGWESEPSIEGSELRTPHEIPDEGRFLVSDYALWIPETNDRSRIIVVSQPGGANVRAVNQAQQAIRTQRDNPGIYRALGGK